MGLMRPVAQHQLDPALNTGQQLLRAAVAVFATHRAWRYTRHGKDAARHEGQAIEVQRLQAAARIHMEIQWHEAGQVSETRRVAVSPGGVHGVDTGSGGFLIKKLARGAAILSFSSVPRPEFHSSRMQAARTS